MPALTEPAASEGQRDLEAVGAEGKARGAPHAAPRPPQVLGCSQVGLGASSVPGSPRGSEAAAIRAAPHKNISRLWHMERGGGGRRKRKIK